MKVPAFANPTLDWRCLTEREMEQLPRSTARRAGRARARALRRRPRRSPSSQLADREQEEHQLGDAHAHAHATATSPPPSHHTRRQRRWRRRPPPPRGVGTEDQQGDEAEHAGADRPDVRLLAQEALHGRVDADGFLASALALGSPRGTNQRHHTKPTTNPREENRSGKGEPSRASPHAAAGTSGMLTRTV